MTVFARTAVIGLGMCLLGAGMSYLYYTSGAGDHGEASPLATGGRYNGPPCLEKKQGTGQPEPYCGDLPSLAAVNVREAKLEQVADGFDFPWAFEFIGDGQLLLTEFSGHLKRVDIDTGRVVDITGLPEIATGPAQAGLLDVVLHPQFADNGLIYFSHAIGDGDTGYALAVTRAELRDDQLTQLERIFVALPYGSSGSNFGGALLFDEAGYLFIATGDRSIRSNSQHPGLLTGKVIRLNADGTVPADNPFVGSDPAVDPAIYALGVRNPQGLVLDSASGDIYETEHGPMGGDEVNVIAAGKNYGWPIITYGANYTYKSIGEGTRKEGLEQPLYYYLPSIAVSPIEIYRGDMFPEWDGDLLVGALKGAAISKLDLVDGRVRSEYKILDELNARIRDIKVAADSSIWILLETGSIYRLSRESSPLEAAREVGERDGEYIYLTVCSTCHSQNVPGAPQISRPSDWTDRLAKDRRELYRNSIKGFNAMPEKGLCEDCTNKEVTRAVNFIISQVKK
ncbi:MAG: PQQ-dependent sugar dehydrogenase [Halieaceae bacterium]|jgi:glucose/arabinose dehydrogenase|nr:PQQ-dependent sugar dehydrogenase [Halieaceae bacterium]